MVRDAVLAAHIRQFSRFVVDQAPQAVADATIIQLLNVLGPSRIMLCLRISDDNDAVVQASTGQNIPGLAKFVFDRKLSVRGNTYGHMQVEIVDAKGDAAVLSAGLETVAIRLSLYAERLRLEQTKEALVQEVSLLKESLAVRKLMARADGIIAEERGISLSAARSFLKSEASRRGVQLLWLADQLITNQRLDRSQPPVLKKNRREVAA